MNTSAMREEENLAKERGPGGIGRRSLPTRYQGRWMDGWMDG